jgi:hypothetical protein
MFNVATNDCPGGQHGTISYRDAGQHNHPVPDPDVMADHDATGPPSLKEGVIALSHRRVIFRTVGEAM